MKATILALLFMFAYPNFTYSQETYEVFEQECLEYKGFQRRGIGGVLQFKNRCGEKVIANVCIEYTNGRTELKDKRKIPKYGRWRINVHTDIPRNVHWASAPYDPIIPPPCGG